MAQAMMRLCACVILLLLMVVVAEEAPKAKKVKCEDKKYPDCYHKDLDCPADCFPSCQVDCDTCQPVCTLSPPPSPPPKQRKHSPPPPLPPPPPPKERKHSPPPPTHSNYTSPPPPVSTPPSSFPPPTNISTPPTPSPPSTSPKKAYCKNKYYPTCYRQEHNCPSVCPDQCEVDCVTCSPVCRKFLIPKFILRKENAI